MKVVSSQWSVVSKSLFYIALCSMLSVLFSHAEAQQPTKVPRIGYLTAVSLSAISGPHRGVPTGSAGAWVRGGEKYRHRVAICRGKSERQRELAAELVRLKVDVIVTSGPTMTRAAKEATVTIPIVMAQDTDPVGNGFVASLARPGGNITGLSTLSPELSGKQLELLKEIIPKLSRVAVLGNSSEPANAKT